MAYAASFRIQPALTIDEGTAKNGVAILREVFDPWNASGSGKRDQPGCRAAAASSAEGLAGDPGTRALGLVRLRSRAVRARSRWDHRRHPALPVAATAWATGGGGCRRGRHNRGDLVVGARGAPARQEGPPESSASTKWPASSPRGWWRHRRRVPWWWASSPFVSSTRSNPGRRAPRNAFPVAPASCSTTWPLASGEPPCSSSVAPSAGSSAPLPSADRAVGRRRRWRSPIRTRAARAWSDRAPASAPTGTRSRPW